MHGTVRTGNGLEGSMHINETGCIGEIDRPHDHVGLRTRPFTGVSRTRDGAQGAETKQVEDILPKKQIVIMEI